MPGAKLTEVQATDQSSNGHGGALRFALFVAIECILVRPASENIVLTRCEVSEEEGAELRPKDVRGNCSTAAAPVPTSTRQRIASGSSGPM